VAQLVELRRERRNQGFETEELNLRIWAALPHVQTTLFHVAPPESGARWNWHLSQDGRFAVAVSAQADTLGRRSVGLYDLVGDDWLWKKNLPWPEAHEAPFVFNRHLVLRYAKNTAKFAMEINPKGEIVGIDTLGKSPLTPTPELHAVPGFSGTPVAVKNGVLFTVDAEHQALDGFALERLPGLYYAGKGNPISTVFSGNGLLKFTAQNGRITVSDALTQSVLQQITAWPDSTNTVVTGALVTHDGSQLSVFLKTLLKGTPAVAREWSLALTTYAGTITPSFNADALLAKPKSGSQKQAVSADGRWEIAVVGTNVLAITEQTSHREIARVSLAEQLGLRTPIEHIAFLEEGRHLLIRQGADTFWLLDFAAARGYADLVARKEASVKMPVPTPPPTDQHGVPVTPAPAATNGAPAFGDLPSGAYFTLRGEWFAQHQAWDFAAAEFEEAAAYAANDGRAPRINPLLQARIDLQAGEKQKAKLVSRAALMKLFGDNTNYNRMIRYQLQGLLFSQAQERVEEPKVEVSEPPAGHASAHPQPVREQKTHTHKSAPLDRPHRSR
jgi:hypothetical protein